METTREYTEQLRQSLVQLSAGLSVISASLPEQEREKCNGIVSQLNRSIIPQLEADCPLLIAVTGGGSTGKSTIFNSLAGKKASAAHPRAGFTRRMVAAIHPKVVADERKMALLFERFRANARPRKLEAANEALQPRDPVYVECPDVPEHLVLIDTPDFDVGTREGFTNRASAKEILDVADAILYIATNATYNNKANTDFVREILPESSGAAPNPQTATDARRHYRKHVLSRSAVIGLVLLIAWIHTIFSCHCKLKSRRP